MLITTTQLQIIGFKLLAPTSGEESMLLIQLLRAGAASIFDIVCFSSVLILLGSFCELCALIRFANPMMEAQRWVFGLIVLLYYVLW
ncbi:hypothetical protein F4677DRAFT_418601 [Hypoxylon crocopeplum]|nr:hypothetical protein F4677DRAFT_418601 [Hypoxylon crocopeplum]